MFWLYLATVIRSDEPDLVKDWQFNLKLTFKGLILVAVPLVFELVLLGTLMWMLTQSEAESRRSEHARAIVWEITSLGSAFYDSAQALFAYRITKSESFARQYMTRRQDAFEELRALNRLAAQDPRELSAAKRVTITANTILTVMDQTKAAMDKSQIVDLGLLERRNEFEQLSMQLNQEVASLFKTEREVARAENQEALEHSRAMVKLAILAGLATNILLAVALAIFFNTGTSRRLAVLMDNTKRLAEQEPLHPRVTGTDEIAHLDSVFHDMAGKLDVTMRKLQAAIENAQDVICSLDSGCRFKFLSPAASKVWGYEPEELTGKRLLEIVSEDCQKYTEDSIAELVSGRDKPAFEIRMIRKDGSLVDTLWSAHWSDKESALFCVAHDVTQQKDLERLKQQFMNMVTHDLRSPLTSLRVAMELMNDGMCGELPEGAQKKLATMNKSVIWLIELINDLLDIDKMEAGKMELDLGWQPVYMVCEKVYATVSDLAADHEVDLDLPGGELRVYGDGDRIAQVIINLLGNAIKFSPKGSTVKVTAEASVDFVEFKVIDEGRGIPATYKERIFERFQQVSVTDATVKGGTGLGLTICKAIVDAHGGTIGVDSEEGKGTTMWFRLPVSVPRA